MATQPAYIKPELLRWARERANIPLSQLTTKFKKFAQWQDGRKRPSFSQAQKVAQALRVPFGYLFLSSPPSEGTPIPDLRTIPASERGSFSVDFIDVLNDAILKQEWYRDFLQSEGAESLPFIGKYSATDNPNRVAADIRQHLGIENGYREKLPTWEAFLSDLIKRVEDLRILVLRAGIVGSNTRRPLSVEEFRGFVITDSLAPLIFINGKDARAAQIFTLVHELAHLWMGQSGIDNPDLAHRDVERDDRVERLCNHVAAEVLVPEGSFLTDWKSNRSTVENVRTLSRQYRVSSLVILRRAFDLRKLGWQEYTTAYRDEIDRFQTRTTKGGGDYYSNLESRNSRHLIRTVLMEAFEGNLLYRDAASLLGVKVDKLERVGEQLGVR